MVDKVKPLKIEDATSGTETDFGPIETDPAEDYLATKGLALENSDLILIDVNGNEITFTDTINGTKKVSDLLDAEQEDFDPQATGLVSTKTGPAIRELSTNLSQSASPGFSWGKSGTVNTNSWLLNEGVPSNTSGRVVTFSNAKIERIYSATQNLDSYTISIYEHEGDEINLTLLTTLVVSSSRKGDSGAISVNVTMDRQIGIKITSGSAKNMIVGMILSGENT